MTRYYNQGFTKDESKRAEGDFYSTDPVAIDLLLAKYELPRDKKIWECACGMGHLSKRLIEHGYDVTSSDLYDRGYGDTGVDFLDTTELRAPIILTNPPFKYARQFITHSIQLGASRVIMFLRTAFLEGATRYKEIYSVTPPRYLFQFIRRANTRNNNQNFTANSSIAFCWMAWHRGYIGKPSIVWI